jgi:foldase protein PrsA
MSERTHSEAVPAGKRGRMVTFATGTVVALVLAGVAFQIYRAEPGAAQTRDAQASGQARVGTGAADDEPVARVNGQTITYQMLAQETVERYGEEVLDNIINRKIIEQACQQAGTQITQGEIDAEVVSIAKKFNIDVANWYALLASERNIGKLQYQRDVIYPMIALKKLAGQNIEVTNEDLQRAFVRDYGPRVEARMILVQGNQRQAAEVWEKCRAAPDDFGRIARELSADPNTRPLGGVVPPIRRYGGADQLETEAFKLKIGEVSGVIEVGEGRYVILKCEGHTSPIVTDIREVEQELRAQILEEKTQAAVAKVFEQIKQRSTVVNYITRESTSSSTAAAPGATGQPAPAGAGGTNRPQQFATVPGATGTNR